MYVNFLLVLKNIFLPTTQTHDSLCPRGIGSQVFEDYRIQRLHYMSGVSFHILQLNHYSVLSFSGTHMKCMTPHSTKNSAVMTLSWTLDDFIQISFMRQN